MKLKQNTKLIIKKMKFNIYSRWYLFNYDIYMRIYYYFEMFKDCKFGMYMEVIV